MNNQDQWFEPGDKVMRVAHASNSAMQRTNLHETDAPYGQVFNVEECSHHKGYSWVALTGINLWLLANNFRKVEEIRLCVEAVKKTKTKKSTPALLLTP